MGFLVAHLLHLVTWEGIRKPCRRAHLYPRMVLILAHECPCRLRRYGVLMTGHGTAPQAQPLYRLQLFQIAQGRSPLMVSFAVMVECTVLTERPRHRTHRAGRQWSSRQGTSHHKGFRPAPAITVAQGAAQGLPLSFRRFRRALAQSLPRIQVGGAAVPGGPSKNS